MNEINNVWVNISIFLPLLISSTALQNEIQSTPLAVSFVLANETNRHVKRAVTTRTGILRNCMSEKRATHTNKCAMNKRSITNTQTHSSRLTASTECLANQSSTRDWYLLYSAFNCDCISPELNQKRMKNRRKKKNTRLYPFETHALNNHSK